MIRVYFVGTLRENPSAHEGLAPDFAAPDARALRELVASSSLEGTERETLLAAADRVEPGRDVDVHVARGGSIYRIVTPSAARSPRPTPSLRSESTSSSEAATVLGGTEWRTANPGARVVLALEDRALGNRASEALRFLGYAAEVLAPADRDVERLLRERPPAALALDASRWPLLHQTICPLVRATKAAVLLVGADADPATDADLPVRRVELPLRTAQLLRAIDDAIDGAIGPRHGD